jgi:hypothetical protein
VLTHYRKCCSNFTGSAVQTLPEKSTVIAVPEMGPENQGSSAQAVPEVVFKFYRKWYSSFTGSDAQALPEKSGGREVEEGEGRAEVQHPLVDAEGDHELVDKAFEITKWED